MKLSVIIVNYNVKYFLEQCLHAVLEATNTIMAEVIVVDNNSSDGSLPYLQPLFPSVKFIVPGDNLGFGKANNLALKEAAGEYVLFLNPDTIVPEDCFVKCLGFFEDHSKAGAIGVRMLDGTGTFLPESKRSFPTTATAFFKLTGLSAAFPKSAIFNKYALGYLDDQQNHQVDVLAGAFMMVRKIALDKTGGFDEEFFMYGEDIDLSYRLKESGYENWYFAGTSIIHFKGESLKKWSSNHLKVFYEAMMIFVKKHYRGAGSLPLRFLLLAGIKSRALASLASSKFTTKVVSRTKAAPAKGVIVGSHRECYNCYSIFKRAGKEKRIVEWFDVKPGTSLSASALQQFCKNKQATMIVFSTGTLPIVEVIGLMKSLGAGFSYRIHVSGSKSIVGSDSKSDLGEVIA